MQPRRLIREEKTLQVMLSIYCRHHHRAHGLRLCSSCKDIEQYAIKRLYSCPFQEKKPTCANCLIHCYTKEMQDKVREVMRYSGPRLTYKHPFLALCHILDGRIKPQQLKAYNKEK